MEYTHTTTIEPVVNYLTEALKQHLLADEKVLWLLSGGSGAKVCLEVAAKLTDIPLEKLYVALSDERYGPVGHTDENWQQLLDGGFSLQGATLYRTLNGTDREATTQAFAQWLDEHLTLVDYRIGMFGIGPDGHTAGIKPNTSAVSSTDWATSFTGEDFERITMTFGAIERLDEVVIQAMGSEKVPTLRTLIGESIDPAIQPAQVLKRVPKYTLFTDYEEK